MAETLSVFKTYNCRTVGSTIKRGRILNDWERFGIYYGAPASLHVHDFSNWNVIVFDYAALELGTDPADYPGTEVYLYIPFADKFAIAAMSEGDAPPAYDAAACAALREKNHRKIDAIMAAGFAGVFWDTCDTGYWDWSYCLESSNILKAQLQEYCEYVRLWGGKNFVNGTPWYIDCGEICMLESFMATWSGNIFAPDWAQNDFFIKYTQGLEETGILGGIPWSTGIYFWLYAQKYAPGVDMFAHSYGDPKSIWQHDKQLFSLAGSLALGLKSWNYIEPTNQTLITLWAHSFYVGAPLECPQVDCKAKTGSRRYSGATTSFNEKTSTGVIDMDIEPDYWWNIEQDFEHIDFETNGTEIVGENRTFGLVPEYLKIESFWIYDDRTEVYFRMETTDTFIEADVLPFFFYMQLDPALGGFDTGRSPADNSPYLYFKDLKAQIYLYGRSIFYWDLTEEKWVYLYAARYHKKDNYVYYAIRKETLKFAVPTWDEINIRVIPFFLYEAGNSYFADMSTVTKPGCLPDADLMPFGIKYQYVTWYKRYVYDGSTSEVRPYNSCPMPLVGVTNDTDYNQVRITPIVKKDYYFFELKTESTWSYSCMYNFTVYGYAACQCQMQSNVYAPHSAVIYSTTGQVNQEVTQVTITGNFDKAWIFDRETAKFVGPDDTPDTYYTTSPFSPTKTIDGQDIYVAIANNETSPTLDTWEITDVQVTLANWGSTHDPGYDIALPDLLEWQSVYEDWKEVIVAETIENTYLPAGIKRGGLKLKKDSVKNTFTVSVASSGAIVEALETYDITNAALLMRRTYEDLDYDDPDSTELIVWAYVDSWELTDSTLIIRARLNFHNWGAIFPKRRASYFCPFVFKGPQCGYGGAALACDKTLTTCTSLLNQARFGGIPTLPRLQRGKWG